MGPHRSALGTVVFAAAALLAPLPQAQAKILAQWVELGPDGSSSARAITDDAACPAVSFDGVAVPMATRSEPEQKLRQCEAGLNSGARL